MNSELIEGEVIEDDAVLLRVDQGVAVISLNRPKVMNAINHALMVGLLDKISLVASNPEVACVVLTGEGRAFCAGGDIKEGARPPRHLRPKRPQAEPLSAYLQKGAEAARLLHEMSKPVIAMVNGPVAGGGIGMIGACDLRFASSAASFVSAYDRIGGSGDYGATWFWSRILGDAKARELFFIGEKYNAEAALGFGLYHRVFEPEVLEAEVMKLARRLASGCGASWSYMKSNLNMAQTLSLGDHLLIESTRQPMATKAHRDMKKEQASLD